MMSSSTIAPTIQTQGAVYQSATTGSDVVVVVLFTVTLEASWAKAITLANSANTSTDSPKKRFSIAVFIKLVLVVLVIIKTMPRV